MGRTKRMRKPTGFLYEKLRARWDTLADFLREKRCPASAETVRKLIYDQKPVSSVSLVAIAYDLGCTPGEIKRMLTEEAKKYIQEKSGEQDYAKRLSNLIGSGSGESLTDYDKTLLDTLHELSKGEPHVYSVVAYFIAMLARAAKREDIVKLMMKEIA
jgi:hypothetical protein